MANEVDTGVTTALYANMVQAALFTLQESTVIRPLVRSYDMTGTPGLVAQVPIYPTLTADSPNDGADLSNKAFEVTTSKTITAAERGTLVTLSDLAQETASEDVAAAIGRQIGQAMALKVDQDLSALFGGFSNTVGSGAAEITVEDLFKAAATLRANNAPGPYFCVLHPYQAFQIKKQLTNAGNTNMVNPSDLGNEALRSNLVGNIAGMTVFESTTITGDSSGAFVGGAFSSDAMAIMMKRNIRLEEQRDASLRATEIVGSMAYGVSEIFDEYGVGIIGDAAL